MQHLEKTYWFIVEAAQGNHANSKDMSAMDRFLQMYGMADVWLSVAYMICVFNVATFRPDQIHERTLLVRSLYLFGSYLVLPAVAEVLLHMVLYNDQGVQNRLSGTDFVLDLVKLVAKALFACSVVCGVTALLPPKSLTRD